MSKKIDIHSHVFDLNFLPVAGAIKGISKNKFENGLPDWICNSIAKHYLKRTRIEPLSSIEKIQDYELTGVEFEELVDILSLKVLTKSLPINSFSFENNELADEKIKSADFREFVLEEFGSDLLLNIHEANRENLENAGLSVNSTFSDFAKFETTTDNQLDQIQLLNVLGTKHAIREALNKIRASLNWFNFMTMGYTSITDALFNGYKEIDLFIHHDMDMDSWYPLAAPEYSPYEKTQVDKMSELMLERKGKLICFYAFNPKKGVQDLEDAILGKSLDETGNLRGNSKGYLGVKVYPPSGYQPWYKDQSLDNQIANMELYKLCQENRIPLFTHCNYGGMEAGKDFYKYGDVAYWKKVLFKYKKLILCFGHAGGDEGWLGRFDEIPIKEHKTFKKSYPGQIYALCNKYENVYCDFGYTPEVMDSEEDKQRFIERMVWCIKDSRDRKTDDTFLFEKKILYGTDYHMLMQHHGYRDYYEFFSKKIFSVDLLKDHFDNFFGNNALSYLRLDEYIKRNENGFLTNEMVTYLTNIIRNSTTT